MERDLRLNKEDVYYFHEGTHERAYEFMGAQIGQLNGEKGVRFTLWSPHSKAVYVVGTFNRWDGGKHRMEKVPDSNLWTLFIAGVEEGDQYKYELHTEEGRVLKKSDPFGFFTELRPGTSSIVQSLDHHQWQDHAWLQKREKGNPYQSPLWIYEVHLGSWKKRMDQHGEFWTYRELADELVDYVHTMGYTHIEILPIMEHPLDESWGYQTTGFFSVTSRYGTPCDFMYLVDRCHQKGVGVLLDWVPGHFCKDEGGLAYFDGKAMFEYDDFRKADNKGWGTLNFNLDRHEVQSYLMSNALFWYDRFHIDGIRVDAVSNMLYLNFGRDDGEWETNIHGGQEDLEGVAFLQKLNQRVYKHYPFALMMAEESTAYPKITHPVHEGGLGFNFKWNMGWMNDTLKYMEKDPIYRSAHHYKLTFTMTYSYSENFILPLSHDEVVHLKKPLIKKMPGDEWQQFANLRCYLGYMATHPGKKLTFMGSEIPEPKEWNVKESLEWWYMENGLPQAFHCFKRDLVHFYRAHEALWKFDHQPKGFQWIEADQVSESSYSYFRRGSGEELIVLLNFTPVVREGYFVNTGNRESYVEVLNSDRKIYGGSDVVNEGVFQGERMADGRTGFMVTLPPLSIVIMKKQL